MKTVKTIAVIMCLIILTATAATAESVLNEDFASFGISSIGIYTEGYKDERVEDFETDYKDAYRAQSVGTFRYTLCDYNEVTPKLMTPDYPLNETASPELDEKVGEVLADYIETMEWTTERISDFNGANLSGLLESAAEDGIDAVLTARYYKIEYYVPISGYSRIDGYDTITLSANVGKLRKGTALLPALELFDTRTGVRLWYSAYWTGNISEAALEDYQTHTLNTGKFFIEGEDTESSAVAAMVDIAMDSGNFPESSASGSRNESIVNSYTVSPHFYWTDYPEYEFYGTLIGVGYNFSYVGNFDLFYLDDAAPRDDQGFEAPYDLVGTAVNTMMHTLTIPMFTFATANISFDPGFYFGFLQPASASINYTDYETVNYEAVGTDKAADVSVWGLTVGLDAALKYYLRFNDTFSAFVGGRGLIEMWLVNVNTDTEIEGLETYFFNSSATGLATEVFDMFTVNASILAGVRLDTSSPVEFFGMLTPVGPGGGPMISLGINYYGATFEWVSPHAKNVEPMMRW